MPLYEVKCKCGFHESEIRTIAEGPRQKCPKCGKKLTQEFGVPRMEVGGYSPMHPRKLRGRGGRRV